MDRFNCIMNIFSDNNKIIMKLKDFLRYVFRYNILKIFQRYGEISSFELLFHKSGVKEGEPRGYCFVEFKTREVSARGSSDIKEMRKC